MIVAIQGSRNFDEYQVFLRAMGTALAMMEEGDSSFSIYSAGPANLNSMALEFSNISERSLKARGIKINLRKVPVSLIKDSIKNIDYFAYFSKPKEPVSDLVRYAENKDAEVSIFRY